MKYFYFKEIYTTQTRRKIESSRRCDICNFDVHRASYAKHLRSKKHLENIRQNDIIIPDCLFKEKHSPIMKKKYTIVKLLKR